MKKYLVIALLLVAGSLQAQELYVFSEPASNMPKGSIGVRLNNKLMKMNAGDGRYRLEPELMFGISKKLMLHTAFYASDIYTGKFKAEGGSVYAKYRFLSAEDIHSHFRMAAFAKVSVSNNPAMFHAPGGHSFAREIDLDGNNSGWQTGVIATQLLHKLALSSTLSYVHAMDNLNNNKLLSMQPGAALNYSLSAGYLLLPKEISSYKQTNFNLYLEYAGQSFIGQEGNYQQLAPAVQFIFGSIARLDLGAVFTIDGKENRMADQSFLLRFEYNFLNAFKIK